MSPGIEARPLWRDGEAPSTRTVQRLCDLVIVATAAAFAQPADELRAKTRRAPCAAFARQAAMYLAHVGLGLSFREVGHAFCRNRTTVTRACALVEERRDDPAIDALLESLEGFCGALRGRPAARGLP
jgi:chromosomal replication initiation ATPase DnaA